ncbi:MAG: precorrin-4 C(11)-methyltransferase [Sporichthyaceae bacterium]
MKVHFIGAGPGAPDLLTLRGRDLIAASPVCLYAGSLVPAEILAWCPPGARLLDTAGMDLDHIIAACVDAQRDGHDVARLHSGDPSLYSAMAEQMRRLDAAGIDYDVTPGVPAYAAAAATLRRELTVPGVGQSVLLTRISAQSTPMPAGEDLATLARSRITLVLHLAVQRIEAVVAELLGHYGASTAVAVIAQASRAQEVILRGDLADIADQVRAAGISRTAVIIVGDVLTADQFSDSHLYSAARCRDA